MSSLLNKLRSHGGDRHHHDQTRTALDESYNNPSSSTGYAPPDSNVQGDTTSSNYSRDPGYVDPQNTSSGYDNSASNAHSDGGRYYAPRGTAVGTSNNAQQGYEEPGYQQKGYDSNTGGNKPIQQGYEEPVNRQTGYGSNPLGSNSSQQRYQEPRDQQAGYGSSQIGNSTTRQDYREPQEPQHPLISHGSNKVGRNNNQSGYRDTTQGAHSSNLANEAKPRVSPNNSRDNYDYGITTTTTTATSTSTSVGHEPYGGTSAISHDSNKRLPADPAHSSMRERLNPNVETNKVRFQEDNGNTGYRSTTQPSQPGAADELNKPLPDDSNRPTVLERANPGVQSEPARGDGTDGSAGYDVPGSGNTTGMDPYDNTHGSNKRLPRDPNAPTILERMNPKVDTASPRTKEGLGNSPYDNIGSGNDSPNLSSGQDSSQYGNDNQYAAGFVGASGIYNATDPNRHHARPVPNDDSTIMNRSHPPTRMHPSDKRYDPSRTDHRTGPDGEYLHGPAPSTAGPHDSNMLNKLDPRMDSNQSKLEKEREQEGYRDDSRNPTTESGYAQSSDNNPLYGNERERLINEGLHDRNLNDTSTGIDEQRNPSSFNSPASNRDSGYGGSTRERGNIPPLPQRKPVNETGSYGNDPYTQNSGADQHSRGDPADDSVASNQGGTYSQMPATSQSTYGNNPSNLRNDNAVSNQARPYNDPSAPTGQSTYDKNPSKLGDDESENDFTCAKCGHKNTHLRRNRDEFDGGQVNAASRRQVNAASRRQV